MGIMMMITVVLTALAAVGMFYGLQPVPISFTVKQEIQASSDEVFTFLADPKNYIHIHPKLKAWYPVSERATTDTTRELVVIFSEYDPYMGIFNMTVNMVIEKEQKSINFNTVEAIKGLITFNNTHWFKDMYDDDGDGDVIGMLYVEEAFFTCPWLLKSYCKRNAVEAQERMLNNVKFILEEIPDVDGLD